MTPQPRDSAPNLGSRPRALRRLYRALDAHDCEGERTEIAMVRHLQFVMAVLAMPMIASLGLVYLAGGHVAAAAWAFAFVAATALLVGALVASGRFWVLRIPHTLCVGALPIGLAISLGGFVASGGVMLWSLLLPVAATMFGFRRRTLYFAGVIAALVLVYLTARPERGVFSARELEFQFAFNTVGFTAFLFMSVGYFVSRIDQEKAKADQLLRRVLPAPIVRRLKRGPAVIADHHDAVTVVFADIVGFTPLAARLSASEVVELLDEVFRRFDALAATYGVEKIKTIGDAYMAVAGAPVQVADHAARAARLAVAMRDAVAELAAARDIELAMRIGMHSGDAVAGVIGMDRFAYDLWGDTVNTASRMESHGLPGKIQLTAATRSALGEGFTTVERGPIDIKGRGILTTYWLE